MSHGTKIGIGRDPLTCIVGYPRSIALYLSKCSGVQRNRAWVSDDDWPDDRNHLHIDVNQYTKFEIYGVKRSAVIYSTRCGTYMPLYLPRGYRSTDQRRWICWNSILLMDILLFDQQTGFIMLEDKQQRVCWKLGELNSKTPTHALKCTCPGNPTLHSV